MKKKGFTLIELLAVIIILGILMLIAIPSVTSYINNSRKETYVDTINELIKGTVVEVNSGEFDTFDTDTTYYIHTDNIKLDNGEARSPYGKITDAYVVVTYDGEKYDYYFVGKDDEDYGVANLISSDKLTKDFIVPNIDDIDLSIGIDDKSNIIVIDQDGNSSIPQKASNTTSGDGNKPKKLICKRAKILHTEECSSPYGGCVQHYNNGDTITYGNLGIKGELNVGDAFDCDVNGDGNYDSTNERFYYISDYYDTHTKSFDSSYAALVYYTNFVDNAPSNGTSKYAYKTDYREIDNTISLSYCTWLGPVTARKHLPTSDNWSNISLKDSIRTMYGFSAEDNNITVINSQGDGKTYNLISNFSYEGYSARLLTAHELKNGCNVDIGGYNIHISQECRFMLESTYYSNSNNGTRGLWLENPKNDSGSYIWVLYNGGSITDQGTSDGGIGTRPVIDVLKDNIEK